MRDRVVPAARELVRDAVVVVERVREVREEIEAFRESPREWLEQRIIDRFAEELPPVRAFLGQRQAAEGARNMARRGPTRENVEEIREGVDEVGGAAEDVFEPLREMDDE